MQEKLEKRIYFVKKNLNSKVQDWVFQSMNKIICNYLSCGSSCIDIKAGIIDQISIDTHRDDLFFLKIPFNFQGVSSFSYFPDKNENSNEN